MKASHAKADKLAEKVQVSPSGSTWQLGNIAARSREGLNRSLDATPLGWIPIRQREWGRNPMDGRDSVVMQAIRNVVGRRSLEEWWALSARQRTEAIYAEIKYLDEKAIRDKAALEQSDRPLVYALA